MGQSDQMGHVSLTNRMHKRDLTKLNLRSVMSQGGDYPVHFQTKFSGQSQPEFSEIR